MIIRPKIPAEGKLLKRTTSRCPECGVEAAAFVYEEAGKVFLRRFCRAHGERTALISSDARFYHVSLGAGSCGASCGCHSAASDSAAESSSRPSPSHYPSPASAAATAAVSNPVPDSASLVSSRSDPFDVLSTCLALIEIVDSCNLACPTCYADSPRASHVAAISFDDFRRRVEGVIARKGRIDILQLSGGEPTLHPEFFELLDWAQDHDGIGYVLINTNGVRLASDAAFAAEMDARYRRGRVQLYLQFDGAGEGGQVELRGADLRAMRKRALEVCGAFAGGGLPSTLAMTVTPTNLGQLWGAVAFGLAYPHVRGVAFQPMFGSGRTHLNGGAATAPRLNTADVILGLIDQSAGTLRAEDFTPLPCGDPNCATIGYLLKMPSGEARSISHFVDFSQIQGFLADRLNYSLEDLARCGCEAEPLGELLKRFELDPSRTFRLFIKPFMDAWSWDQDRIDRCCTHVIRPDGKLDSFCRYYSGLPGTWGEAGVEQGRGAHR